MGKQTFRKKAAILFSVFLVVALTASSASAWYSKGTTTSTGTTSAGATVTASETANTANTAGMWWQWRL